MLGGLGLGVGAALSCGDSKSATPTPVDAAVSPPAPTDADAAVPPRPIPNVVVEDACADITISASKLAPNELVLLTAFAGGGSAGSS